jgi:hypothetical protein
MGVHHSPFWPETHTHSNDYQVCSTFCLWCTYNCHSPAAALDPLEDEHILPVHVEVVPPSREHKVLTSRSDTDFHAPVEESIQIAANIVEDLNEGVPSAQTFIFQMLSLVVLID